MESPAIDKETLELATQDVRRVLERQKEERQILITQMNILFVTNSAILSFLTISKLITEEEFRIQEPESRMDSVRLDGESRFKAPDFNRGEEKILSLLKPLTLGMGYSEF
ncbi:hypothetical protein [Nostoc sp. CHAB 5715]|uniref:hypothetical protein n=1 Tax=Nostoc sp. CHAB 5715 TaxID=2780400 RepID=UPI001E560787|nr:hypothetical protein [Nostoc sp. CHAB 5715]MCC5624607.1 hypothetical protein [Nostoc sp. CHAB 5715]